VTFLTAWTRQAKLDEPFCPHRWFEQITLGRALAGAGRKAEAERFLARIAEGAERAGCADTAVRAKVALAAIRQAAGDAAGAVALLEKARELAAEEPYVRVFLDEGATLDLHQAQFGGQVSQAQPGLLSERELEVLRLMAGGLENQAIAERLVVTRGTAKWHIHNILTKLEATNRTEAVARARELRLI
jgi:LuxR family maltose regulon positive regulatory protein